MSKMTPEARKIRWNKWFDASTRQVRLELARDRRRSRQFSKQQDRFRALNREKEIAETERRTLVSAPLSFSTITIRQ